MRNLIRALIAALPLTAVPLVSQAGLFIGVSVGLPPPALPVYVQPPCPSPGYMWIPGYWAWDDGYYWVPGTWVLAPEPGLLWTPGYWGWAEGSYVWHAGYWGPQVGFYGGINYGFGYTGSGYEGGYWHGHEFYYNRAVTNINTTNITTVYNRTVINNVNVTRVSFNGGAGGVSARPTPAEMSAEHERHLGLTAMQRQQEQLAHSDEGLRAAVNGGHPPIAATPRPGTFTGHGVVASRGGDTGPAAAFGGGREAGHAAEPARGMTERAPARASESAPIEQRQPAHVPQYAARSSERPEVHGATNEGQAYQPRPEPQAQAQFATRPAPQYPQYQPQHPEARHPQAQYPQAQYPQAQYPQAQYPHYQPQVQHPQYQAQPAQPRPQPQMSSQPARPAPQGPAPHVGPSQPGHGQQAARPEHGGEHNRQG